MKKILVFCLSITFISVVYARLNTVLELLEAGKFEEAKIKINLIKDENLVNLYHGIYHLYHGNYETAVYYVTKTTTTNLDEQEKFFMFYIPRLYEIISNGYQEYESEHFKIYLKGRDIILKEKIIDHTENMYKIIGEKFGYYPKEKVRIEVYNTKDEFSFASTLGKSVVDKSGVVGICKFNRIMIVSPESLPFGYRWCDTITHEYIHFILNRISEYKLPLYLHEATARYYDTILRSTEPLCFSPGSVNLLLQAKKEGKLLPFLSLKGSLVYLDSQQDIELAFVELTSFVKYIINTYGEENYLKLIHLYKNYVGEDEKLYSKIFGVDHKKLISLWEQNIDGMFESLSFYSGALPDWKFITANTDEHLIGLNLWQYIELGDKFLNKKDYTSAVFQYKKAQKYEEYNPVVLTRLGKTYLKSGMIQQAEDVLKKCITANPNYVVGYELLFKVYYEKAEYEKAVDIYNKHIIELNPFNYEVRKIIAEIYSDLGKIQDALNEYKIVEMLNPADKEVSVIIDTLNRYLELKKGNKK